MRQTLVQDVLDQLAALGSEHNRAGMARFGINVENAYGVGIPPLRQLARTHRRDHPLALALWTTGKHEARLLAAFVDDPRQVTEEQMESWVRDFDSWDLCDQVCGNLFDRTPFAPARAVDWAHHQEQFVRRAGFVLMTQLAVHDKRAPDSLFLSFLPLVEHYADDDRNFVRKAVNWALRQIGKRNAALYAPALELADQLREQPSKSARWIGSDAARELRSEAVRTKLGLS